MNNLLKKLCEQAELPTIDGEWDYNDREILRQVDGEWRVATPSEIIAVLFECEKGREKFAELIVEECIREIVYKSVELLDIDFYPHYQERLKKHFGVEE